jgi:hypothetical protein
MGYDHIVYLQPRRVTTDNIAERLEYELSEQFSERGINMPPYVVGMAHSEAATLTDDSIIQVMTSAVYKKRAPELSEKWRGKRVLIVGDEVHEGNIETEFSLATAAEMMTEHDTWNMVLMSATLNTEEIQEAYESINGGPIPSVEVEGRPHEIEYNERPEQNAIDVFFDECIKQGNKTLIFTDGKRSLKHIQKEIEARAATHGGKAVRVLLLHSKMAEATRREIFYGEDDPDLHTVIVSTSAGQSGITISGVDRVISDGWTKSPELDAENASGLPRRLCSRAEITQQMGRGGRDIDGARFFLARSPYDKDGFDSFDSNRRGEHIPADIYHTIITGNVLATAAMDRDFFTLNEYLIHKVSHETIREAYAVLYLLGAVDYSNKVTYIGREMAKYPVPPEMARAIVAAIETNNQATIRKVVAIAAAIAAGGLTGFKPEDVERRKKALADDTDDDFLAELDMFIAAGPYTRSEIPNESQLAELGLDGRNTYRARRQYEKMCRVIGMLRETDDTLLATPLSLEKRKQIKELLLTGMPHLLYDEVERRRHRGRQKRNPDGTKQPRTEIVTYRNMLAPEGLYDYDRTIGRNSLLAQLGKKAMQGMVIAGFPRWFTATDKEGEPVRINVIEKGIVFTPEQIRRVLGATALHEGRTVVLDPDGHLRIKRTGMVGRRVTYSHKDKTKADSSDKVDLLYEAVQEKPGPELKRPRRLKRTLEGYAKRVPVTQWGTYFKKNPLSHLELKQLVRSAAEGAGSEGELDSQLRNMQIQLGDYIDGEKLQAIEKYMPLQMRLAGHLVTIRYDGEEAQPSVINYPIEYASNLKDTETLPDGRELLFDCGVHGHEGLYTAYELKQKWLMLYNQT